MSIFCNEYHLFVVNNLNYKCTAAISCIYFFEGRCGMFMSELSDKDQTATMQIKELKNVLNSQCNIIDFSVEVEIDIF